MAKAKADRWKELKYFLDNWRKSVIDSADTLKYIIFTMQEIPTKHADEMRSLIGELQRDIDRKIGEVMVNFKERLTK